MCRIGFGDRKNDAAIADEHTRQWLPGLARGRRTLAQHRPPEEQLQQQRDIAEGFDVDLRQLADEPIARQPGDADDGPEHRRKDNAERGDVEGIEEANEEGPPVGVGRRIWYQRLAY